MLILSGKQLSRKARKQTSSFAKVRIHVEREPLDEWRSPGSCKGIFPCQQSRIWIRKSLFVLHCVISCLDLQSITLVWNSSGPHSHQWVFKWGRVLFYSGKTKSTLPSNIRQNEITFIKTGTTRKKVQVMKQLGTISFWPKKKLTTLLISIRDQMFRAAIILLFFSVINLCSGSKNLYSGRKGNTRARAKARANHYFNRCCFLSIIFMHFISNSWLAIQITRM